MSKFQLQRRTFLKGLGTTMALPLLEAMLPATARAAGAAAAGKPPVRMAFVFFPNGAIMPRWTPKETGTSFELPELLQPLASVRDDLLVMSGLAHDNARAKGSGAGDHARSSAAFLTGAHPVKTHGADIRVGQSIDQAAAERIGHLTRLPSLELGIERGRNAGNCDSGYSCAYSSNISWKTESTPMAKEVVPKLAFERLFGSKDEAKDRQKRALYRKSILDLVADDADTLRQKLGRTDRRKLDEYFTSVREIELRIERAELHPAQNVPDFEVPPGVPQELAEHVRLMYDLLLLAFQTDTTRIATFMVANEGSNRSFPMVEVNDGWHYLSHHAGDEDKIEKIAKIDRFLVEQFAYFIERLRATPEGEGTLLDNCMIVYGSAIADGNRHTHHDLPVLLAGRGGGTIQPGRHVRYRRDTPMANLFLSMCDRMEAGIERIGDSTGRLKDLAG